MKILIFMQPNDSKQQKEKSKLAGVVMNVLDLQKHHKSQKDIPL